MTPPEIQKIIFQCYRESTEGSMADTEQFVSRVLEKGGGLVRPILTPRFVMMMMITMMII